MIADVCAILQRDGPVHSICATAMWPMPGAEGLDVGKRTWISHLRYAGGKRSRFLHEDRGDSQGARHLSPSIVPRTDACS
jgi:hypothetical protein